MSSTGPASRRQRKLEELCGASMRALSGEPELHFRQGLLHCGARALPWLAPHLQPSPQDEDLASLRGLADGVALRLTLSDQTLHRRLCPQERLQRWVFELLEQLRVESLAPPELPGLARNLRHRFERWCLAFHRSGLTETEQGILLYTLVQVCHSRVTGQPVVEATEDLIEATRAGLVPLLGGSLQGLRRTRSDQQAYAAHALDIARFAAGAARHAGSQDDCGQRAQDEETAEERIAGFSLWLDFDGETGHAAALAHSADSRVLSAAARGYAIFTRAYDREEQAASLVRPELLAELRERLDLRCMAQGLNATRLARRLHALLGDRTPEGWNDGEEEGWIDGRRLAMLVSSPGERCLFRTERQLQRPDCAVSFLIDCSGSMKQHAESVAMLVDVFVRALALIGVAAEVLGFTTGAWNGGRAQRDWWRAGRPKHPGRLNETRHLVFKNATTTGQRGRQGIAALLKTDLFREGVDGEAVDWACRRLEGIEAARRVLFVISDGSPMDGATALANDKHYLDHHLREVVARREAEGRIELYGVGVGLDLHPFYRHSLVLDLSGGLDNAAMSDLLQLVANRKPSAALEQRRDGWP